MGVFLLLPVGVSHAGGTAQISVYCAPGKQIQDRLKNTHGESIVGEGVEQEYVVQRWENAETGTWSVTISYLNGLTCMIAVGTGWQAIPALVKPKGTAI